MQQLILEDGIKEAAGSEGREMYRLIEELFPLPRCITGAGLRATVQRLGAVVPLRVTEVPSGTSVFDWNVPEEWSISEAYVEHESGRRFTDYRASNLHVVGYSTPIDTTMTLAELRPHLHSLPEHPDWIPYRTSFYAPDWGFCLADRVLRSMPDGRYRVAIRSDLRPGSLTLAECVLPGTTTEEVLVFAHDCHPSLANDNLSGLAVAAHVARFVSRQRTRYTYRFVFAPATIGSITWLATNEHHLDRIRHGLVLALLGDSGCLQYKRSRNGSHVVDRAAARVLRSEFPGSRLLDFSPWGYDERQFCSPGINLAVGRLSRSASGEYAEYHTSADNLTLLSERSLGESWLACLRILEAIEADVCHVNVCHKGEPQLGRRGLYRSTGGYYTSVPDRQMALFWILNQSDGNFSLLDIAEKSDLPVHLLARAARDLHAAGLLRSDT